MRHLIDDSFVKGKISLEDVCKLYHKLKHYEENSSAFLHAKKQGIREGYDSARGEIKELISKSKKHGLDDYSLFKNLVAKLTIDYDIK